jgi:hypothetical protein
MACAWGRRPRHWCSPRPAALEQSLAEHLGGSLRRRRKARWWWADCSQAPAQAAVLALPAGAALSPPELVWLGLPSPFFLLLLALCRAWRALWVLHRNWSSMRASSFTDGLADCG